MRRTDVHQHLWPEQLLAELSRRDRAPFVRKSGRRYRLVLDGEPDYLFDLAQHDPDVRRSELAVAGIERALIAPSLPLGIESLSFDEAAPLIDAHHEGVLSLGEPFGMWGTVSLRSFDAAHVDGVLDRGAVGLALPAGALATREGLARVRVVLARLERRGAPLFIHPGPDPLSFASADGTEPGWWPAMTTYVAEMNAAWHAFAAWGRLSHPTLRVVFAMLAGGAVFHLERAVARGGPAAAAHDEGFFYDTSSYGPRGLDAAVRAVGVDQLVYGSDLPVIDPAGPHMLGPAAADAMLRRNADRLITAPVEREAVAA